MADFTIDSSWTLFLDRDGVLNQRNFEGYITSVKDFKILPGVIEGLKRLTKQFNRIIIVTNQQGIGKKMMTEVQLDEIHSFMIEEFSKNAIQIDKVFHASNLRGAINDRRKPGSAMAREAKSIFPEIEFDKSLMVGDTASDIQFGMNL